MRRQSSCQGTRLAWCSISVTTTSSPGPIRKRCAAGSSEKVALDIEYATRLSASVAFLVKTISEVSMPGSAPMNAAVRERADS